jgi:hypothetical protein
MQNTKEVLLNKACDAFDEKLFSRLIEGGLKRASNLEEYNVNPLLIKYLANFGFGDDSPRSIAKALILPRVLGTSITTAFGTHVQNLIIDIFPSVKASIGSGLDIEFVDQVDGEYKYCQLKAGPNTINNGDVEPIKSKLTSGYRLLRTNGNRIVRPEHLIVGVVYGEEFELNNFYRMISDSNPVIVGADLWHRISGYQSFYFELVDRISKLAQTHNAQVELENAIQKLSAQLRSL